MNTVTRECLYFNKIYFMLVLTTWQ